MGGALKEAAAVKKVEEQVRVIQVQLHSHGVDIQDMKLRMETIIQWQDEMRTNMNKLLERSEANTGGRGGSSNTPNSGLITPMGDTTNKSKGIEGSGHGGSGDGGSGNGGSGHGGPGLIFGSFDGNNAGRGRYEYRHRKINMPSFDGTQP